MVKRGTVCAHCWRYWRQEPGHETANCAGSWVAPDGIQTVCMCGCKRKATPDARP
jgi:hypothetical protein